MDDALQRHCSAGYEAAKKLQRIYLPNYRMPSYSLTLLRDCSLELEKSLVLFNPEDVFGEVKAVVTQRVPTNIQGRNLYDEDALERHFGWRESYYQATRGLAPPVATACRTPVWGKGGRSSYSIYIVNLVAPALDSTDQADYRILAEMYSEERQTWVIGRLKEQLYFMLYAAKHYGLSRICWAKIGGGAFSTLYPSLGLCYERLFAEASAEVFRRAEERGIELTHMPSRYIPQGLLSDLSGEKGATRAEEALRTLYVNAWDCHAMVGNGNDGDESLDGYMGRSTAVGVLCWPKSNLRIAYVPTREGKRATVHISYLSSRITLDCVKTREIYYAKDRRLERVSAEINVLVEQGLAYSSGLKSYQKIAQLVDADAPAFLFLDSMSELWLVTQAELEGDLDDYKLALEKSKALSVSGLGHEVVLETLSDAAPEPIEVLGERDAPMAFSAPHRRMRAANGSALTTDQRLLIEFACGNRSLLKRSDVAGVVLARARRDSAGLPWEAAVYQDSNRKLRLVGHTQTKEPRAAEMLQTASTFSRLLRGPPGVRLLTHE